MTSTLKNNKNRQITYDELMNSPFMRFPSHSKIVHDIFNPLTVSLIVMITVGTTIMIIDGDGVFAIMLALICGAYAPIKILMVGNQMTGHGVGVVRNGKFSFLGLSTVATIILSILFIVIVSLNYIAFTAPNTQDFQRVQMFSVSMLFSFIMSLLSWRFHTYYETWYGSRYDAILEFKKKGYSDEEIEVKIKKLKKQGIVL